MEDLAARLSQPHLSHLRMVCRGKSVSTLKHARLAEDRKLEKEEPREDGGEGTAEDCGGPRPDGGACM